MRTPASSIAASTPVSGSSTSLVEGSRAPLDEALAHERRQAARQLGAAHERGSLLVRLRLGRDLDAVLGGEVVELVGRARRAR